MPVCWIEWIAERSRLRRISQGLSAAALVAAACLAAPAASAETLRQALAAAYQTNPKLDAERARLRATDEDVSRANSGYRPTIQGSADYGTKNVRTNPRSTSSGGTNPAGYGLSITQEIFSGFRTVNTVREAEATVRAGRENLRGVETEILLQAVSAYADVIRDQALMRLRESQLDLLTKELVAAEARRAAREVTRTDVAQAKARRAKAASELDRARASLKTSRAGFERVIGHPPQRLSEPAANHKLVPRSLDDAIRICEQESPKVVAALYREQAARYGVDKIWGELLPEVRLEANYSHRTDLGGGIDTEDTASVGGRINVPLYKGGETHARVRQAKHTHVSRIQEIEQARTEARAAVAEAWARLMAARSQLKSDQVQVEASQVALEGVREEERVGQRTIIDVLNAEQELLDAQVQLIVTRHDIIIATYTLISGIGRLTAEALALSSSIYDPEQHTNEVRNKWFGLSITHADGRRQTLQAADPDGETERE